jgi:hypothetical protein
MLRGGEAGEHVCGRLIFIVQTDVYLKRNIIPGGKNEDC